MSSQGRFEEIRVQLNFAGFAREPDELTALVGIVPSKVWRIGESIDKSKRTYKSNGWRISAEPPPTEVEAGVDALFTKVASCWEALRLLSIDCRVELSIVIYVGQQVPAIHLRPDQLDRLAELGASIDIDLYCLDGKEE